MTNSELVSERDTRATVQSIMLQSAKVLDWVDGSAEPWVATVLAALISANGTKTALEVGGFRGHTSRVLAHALGQLPWKTHFTVCEIDRQRAADVSDALAKVTRKDGDSFVVVCASSLDWIPTLPDESVDFVWLDGNHEQEHVLCELHALISKMTPGGIIAGHDVFGTCQLHQIFKLVASQLGGRWPSMSLDFPMLGPAGGIGLLQRPR